MWDLERSKEVRTLKGHTGSVVSLKGLKNGNLVSCSNDDTIKIWNPYLNKNNIILTISGHGNKDMIIPIGVLSNDLLVTYSSEKDEINESTMRVWDLKDGRLVKSIQTGLKAVRALLVLSNDQVAIGTDDGGNIKIIDLKDQSKTRVKEMAHDLVVYCILQLSNGNLLSSGVEFPFIHSINMWKFSNLNRLQYIVTDHSREILSLSVSQDETILASGSIDNTIKLWPIITEDAESS